MDEDDILAELERQSAVQNARLRTMLYEHGRPDLVTELDAKMKDIRLCLDSARATWSALSSAQRRVMLAMGEGRWLRQPIALKRFWALSDSGEFKTITGICGAATVRNLMARELISWEADRKIILTERGRFVLAHGRTKP